jgi:S-adenosylmethionine hydrolase
VTPARITLLTDFGTRDGFVGAMKAVIASLAPGVIVDDIAHDLPAGDVTAAARALARYWRRYPEGTVHLAVVDPGVGTDRAALACAAAGRFLLGPDNGSLTPALSAAWGGAPDRRCVRLDASSALGVAPTFHGRDVFAPAAAALAMGGALSSLGAPFDDPVELALATPARGPDGVTGAVLAIDRFGNATTNLPGAWAGDGEGTVVEVAGLRLRVARTYGDAVRGEAVAVVDSEGRLEVAVREGSAAELLGIAPGTPVRLLPG